MMTEVRGASNAKAKRELGWTPRHPSWRTAFAERRGLSAWTSRTTALRPEAFAIAYRMLGSVGRGRGRGAGGAPARAPRSSRRASRSRRRAPISTTVVTRLAIDELRSARARRETLRRRVAARAARHRRRRRPGRARRAGRVARRSPSSCCSRACRPSSAPCSCCTTSSTTATTRSPRSSARASDNARQLAVRARRHVDERRPRFESSREQRERLAERFFAAVERRRRRGPRGAAGGGRRPARRRRRQGAGAGPARCAAARASRGRCWPGRARARASAASRCARVEVNGQPGALAARPRGPRHQRHGARRRATARCRPSARSSTRTSSRHLGPVGDYGALLEAARRAD